ncbi:MAG: ABC transporter ATP-binding protein [Deltaproteobacteria bacterium]|nr:ABC transporter ATP-binding protein [Deltaproteobacteria bacterium]
MNIIEADNITKSYGPVHALRDVSLHVRKGTIFGLLGPNGAGKTTFVKGLLDIIRIDSGAFHINGKIATDESSRREISFLPENFSFFPYYTVTGVLRFYGKMHGIDKTELKDRIKSTQEELDIYGIGNRKIKTLSKGQKQRLGIAGLLMGNTSVLILDEPYSGLDPVGIRNLKILFSKLKNEGTTILINSHILAEVEQVCDDIAILHEGKCLAQGSMATLKGDSSLEDFFYQTVNG